MRAGGPGQGEQRGAEGKPGVSAIGEPVNPRLPVMLATKTRPGRKMLWGEPAARIAAESLTGLVRGARDSGARLRSPAIRAAGSRHLRPGAGGRGVSGMPIVA